MFDRVLMNDLIKDKFSLGFEEHVKNSDSLAPTTRYPDLGALDVTQESAF